ncbi:MAG TPA: L,D-transpeptidase family protein [Candidatus Limnocylindrales bacterium]|nr:L,D-transpeptidase family protein [Candidatus Limnocylindrales bacterium]
MRSSSTLLTSKKTYTDKRQTGIGTYLRLFFACIMITSIPIFGCSHIDAGLQVRSISQEANDFFNQGKYEASLSKYEQIIEKHPAVADRILFEMGIIYAYPRNEQKDYQKSLECFQKLVRDYPDSEYRLDSQMMTLQIHNVIIKDKIIATQQTQIETSRQEVKDKENEIITLQKKIETLEQKIFALQTVPADKVLIEKKERRLTLLSKGEVIKTYKIALGGNPVGPKERQGDNKTPEGTYIIDSRNRDSVYHLSLHISYPNEKDKMRAKGLGVSPGGDIMIHGIKNGLTWVGASHAEVDWTKGCIAVTDEEMEEIYKLVPNGTITEIRP